MDSNFRNLNSPQFNYNEGIFSQEEAEPSPLFVISNCSYLEIRDCNLYSSN